MPRGKKREGDERMPAKRTSHTQTDKLETIMKWRLEEGMSRSNIIKRLQEETGCSLSWAYEQLRIAAKEFEARAIINFGEDLSEDIERFECDRQAAIARGEYRLAKDLLVEISKLKGHYVERVQNTVNVSIAPVKIIFGKGE